MRDEHGRSRPPGAALRLAAWRVPAEVADALIGDLEEEYRTRVLPDRGRLQADVWFWLQAMAVRRSALRRAARRVQAVRPTWERHRPGGGHGYDNGNGSWQMSGHDLRYALRRMARSPGFTLVAVVSLALGIGANSAMFSVVNAVLLRGLPMTEPERVVEVYTSEANGFQYSTSSHPDYLDLRARTDDVFESVVASRSLIARVDRDDGPAVAFGELVSWDYFQTLGLPIELGRAFLPEEDATPGTHPVVMLSYRTWTQDHGSDPDVLGQEVRLNGRPYTVVGVAGEEFRGSLPVLMAAFWAPLMVTDHMAVDGSGDQLTRRSSRSLFLKARLSPGVTADQADAAVNAVSRGLAETFPDTNTERIMSVIPSEDVSVHPIVDGALVPVAGLLLGVVGLVLLIACANLASFLLARAEDRRKEIAVRLALGAGRGALIRQLMVETTLLAIMGGVAGVFVARWTLDAVMAFQPPIPVPLTMDIGIDGAVLTFTAVVSLAAGLLFGLAPALQATDPDIAPTLKNEATGERRRRFNLRNVLVVGQVALSFVLLIGAGLFVRSLQKAQAIDTGFDTGPAALIWPMPELSGYETPEEKAELVRTLEERLLADAIIDRVARTDRTPLGSSVQTNRFMLPGVRSNKPDGDYDIDDAWVSPSYFDVMGVEVVRGRGFTDADVTGPDVAVVSEAFARRFYPEQDVLGMSLGRPGGDFDIAIVGIARDAKVRTLGEAPRAMVYRAMKEHTGLDAQFIVRGAGASNEQLLAATKDVVNQVDADLVIFEEKTMDQHLALMLFPPRMAALLLTVFGGLALTLSAVGIYGVVSYAVSKRTRELGIRMSLGASARDVTALAVGGGMRLVMVGGAVGMVMAAAVSVLIARFLYGVSSTDVATFLGIPVVLGAVAFVAALVPAMRASRVDPVRALRSE